MPADHENLETLKSLEFETVALKTTFVNLKENAKLSIYPVTVKNERCTLETNMHDNVGITRLFGTTLDFLGGGGGGGGGGCRNNNLGRFFLKKNKGVK